MSKYSENLPTSIIGAIGWFYDDIKKGSTVLDFGCSTGYYGSYLKQHKDCTVYGVEISDDKEEAKKVLDGVYSFDIDGEWPEAVYERKYDAVFFGDVIEHLKDPEAALRKTRDLLSKTSKVFISTPNVAHMSVRLELLGGGFEYESMGILDNTHLKYFTFDSLTKIAIGAGYTILRIDSSESDYPREVAVGLLEQYGLTPNETFWNMMSEATARAFQYKLVLSPRQKGEKQQPIPTPKKKPEQYKIDYISDLNAEADRRQNHIDELEDILTRTNEQNRGLQAEISAIRNSRSYQIVQKIVHLKNSLKRGRR